MQVSDLAEFLANHGGTLTCAKDGAGANLFTVEVSYLGKEFSSVGGDLKAVLVAARDAFNEYVKNRDVVPLQTTKQNQGGI